MQSYPRLLRTAEPGRSKGRPSPYSFHRSTVPVKSGFGLLASRMVKVVVILDSHPQKASGSPDLQVITASSLLASHIDVSGTRNTEEISVSKLFSDRDSWVWNFPGQVSKRRKAG